MSVKQMSLVWEHQFEKDEQAIMLAMADHASHLGDSIFPSVALLQWKTGYSERHIRRVISRLRKRNLLVVVRKASQHRPNEYKIDWSKAETKKAFRPDSVASLEKVDLPAQSSPDLTVESPLEASDLTVESPEPSLKINHHKDSSINAGPTELTYEDVGNEFGDKTKPKKRKGKKKDPRLIHPAIKSYRSIAHLQVPDSWRDDVIRVVGEAPDKLIAWNDLVKTWIGRGWNKGNIKGMIEAFERGGIKSRQTTSTAAERVSRRMAHGN